VAQWSEKFHVDASMNWSKKSFPVKNEEPSQNPSTCFAEPLLKSTVVMSAKLSTVWICMCPGHVQTIYCLNMYVSRYNFTHGKLSAKLNYKFVWFELCGLALMHRMEAGEALNFARYLLHKAWLLCQFSVSSARAYHMYLQVVQSDSFC